MMFGLMFGEIKEKKKQEEIKIEFKNIIGKLESGEIIIGHLKCNFKK